MCKFFYFYLHIISIQYSYLPGVICPVQIVLVYKTTALYNRVGIVGVMYTEILCWSFVIYKVDIKLTIVKGFCEESYTGVNLIV